MNNFMGTAQKALKINLDESIYGTFAEIGAGQEVAGNFFKAGGSSGTIAKSISAYDMTFSDSIYGKEKTGRYVCESRLKKMLDYEYDLLLERLKDKRPEAKFFAFANTVSARNYHGTNEAHGWLGVSFRHEKEASASELILHVRMHDNQNLLQQKALGILGVNMLYASFFKRSSVEEFIDHLMDNLTKDRIEINMIKANGEAFKHLDERLLNLQLVKSNITDAVLFDTDGKVELASDIMYKKNILVTRGSFRPPTKVSLDILKTGLESFSSDLACESSEIIPICEITLANLKEDGEITSEDFLARVDLLASIKQRVLISNFPQYYKLSAFFSKFKAKNIGIVLGTYNFGQIFNEDYTNIEGGLLAAFGNLFRENVRVYLYPYKEDDATPLVNSKNLPLPNNYGHFYQHILSTGKIKDIDGYDASILHIYSRKILKMIISGERGWEEFVPKEIAKTINDKCLFGHPCELGTKD